MRIKRYVRSYLFYIVIALLLVSITASVMSIATISKKNKIAIQSVQNELKEAHGELGIAQQQLQAKTEENEKLEKELMAAEKENSNLKKENKVYKKEIEKLSAKKQAEVEKAVADKLSPQSKYPNPTKTCYLTFDDGPSDNTLEILKILKKYDAKATFFVIGTAKLEYLPKIQKAGHAIGLHSNTHEYSQIYKSTTAFFKDLNKLSAKVEKQIGEKVNIMRFPGGSNNTISRNYRKGIMTSLVTKVKAKGYAYFDWNVDSGDASGHNVAASKIKKNVLKQAENKKSICVLMHDTAAKGTTVKALPGILEGLKKQGYKFEVLTEETYGYHYKVKN